MLAKVLESLVQQTLDKAFYEIIVVDNASKDNTSQIVEEFQAKHPESNIILLRENQLGLGHARNTGFRHARGDYVAFIDDDAQASADWLETALSCFEGVQPRPLGIGGLILPLYDSPKPQWFKDEYEVRTWGNQPRFLNHGESFAGSNMIFRREVLKEYGGFETHIGVKGEYLLLGEETALYERIWQFKGDADILYYSPRLIVFHAVPSYKMTVSYRLKRAFAGGKSWYLQHGPRSLYRRLTLLLRILVSISKLGGLALVHLRGYPTYKNWIVERLAPIAEEMGRLAGCLGLSISVRQR